MSNLAKLIVIFVNAKKNGKFKQQRPYHMAHLPTNFDVYVQRQCAEQKALNALG